MMQSLQLAPGLLAQMSQTFGASAVLMSPLFDLFLLAAAVLLIISFFKYTEPNSAIRNFMTGYGLFELLRNGFNYLFVSNQTQSPVIHTRSSPGFFPPASYRPAIHGHHSHQYQPFPGHNGHIHGQATSPTSQILPPGQNGHRHGHAGNF